jgi:hypothetical protein
MPIDPQFCIPEIAKIGKGSTYGFDENIFSIHLISVLFLKSDSGSSPFTMLIIVHHA